MILMSCRTCQRYLQCPGIMVEATLDSLRSLPLFLYLILQSYNDRKVGSPLYSYSYRDERCSKSTEYSAVQRSAVNSYQWTRMHWIGVRRSFMIACERNVTEWRCPRGHWTNFMYYITCHSNSCYLLVEYHDWPVPDMTWLDLPNLAMICLALSCLVFSSNCSIWCKF